MVRVEDDAQSLRHELGRLSRLERRVERLFAVTRQLATATTLDAIARIVVEPGIAAVGGAYGGLWLLDPDARELRLLAMSALPRGDATRWRVIPLDLDAPLPEAVRGARPVIASLAELSSRYPATLERMRETMASGDLTYAALPLASSAAPFGGLAVVYEDARELDASERMIVEMLAAQSAQAIERVRSDAAHGRAPEVERQAPVEADDVMRARAEILSVVSHDLRNPLGTISMGASTLLQVVDGDDPRSQRIRTIAERIHRQSERMARLISDLADYAGIQAGKLAIVRRPCAPETIVRRVDELYAPIAKERGIVLETRVASGLPAIECDGDRVVQVLANLCGNAFKVTRKTGVVAIGARLEAGAVVFSVHDSGPGLDDDELPRLFERDWRSNNPLYKGAGLALAIAHGIVAAHGGRIWADSAPAAGCTFHFTLTPAP